MIGNIAPAAARRGGCGRVAAGRGGRCGNGCRGAWSSAARRGGCRLAPVYFDRMIRVM